jgi:hypothetical protein
VTLDHATQEKGKQLHEVMRMFKQTTTLPLSSFLLHTPHKNTVSTVPPLPNDPSQTINRARPSLKAKKDSGKSITRSAQDLVAKKCGVIQQEDSLDDMTLQEYLQLYKHPLSESDM